MKLVHFVLHSVGMSDRMDFLFMSKNKMEIEKASFGLIRKAIKTGKTDLNGFSTGNILILTSNGTKGGTSEPRYGRKK